MSATSRRQEHGLGGYTARKCRCEICSAANSAYQKAWWKKNGDKTKQYRRDNYASTWRKSIKDKFGLDESQYNEMLSKQDGVCAICRVDREDGRRLAVDHCHETGKIRGLLCSPCNLALGQLGDNIEGLERALNYIRKATRP